MGPLISAESAKTIIEAVDESVKAGGKVLVGGRLIKGSYVEPTLFEVPDKDALLGLVSTGMRSSLLWSLSPASGPLEDAIDLANGRRFQS